jgi:Nucleotide modification associated domain 2
MPKIYSYVLRYDDGAAPNPFWNVCTLAICKPAIRRTAMEGDWVLGTGSKNAFCNDGLRHDLSGHLVYAMKINDKLSLEAYDRFCQAHLPAKIPDIHHDDWRRRMGDCIYDFTGGNPPGLRPGVHTEQNRIRDLSGECVLLSRHFYYFGEGAVPLPADLLPLVQAGQGHRKIERADLVEEFEAFTKPFPLNTIAGEPQLKHAFDGPAGLARLAACASCHLEEDGHEGEEVYC